jgi:hypothetical protein
MLSKAPNYIIPGSCFSDEFKTQKHVVESWRVNARGTITGSSVSSTSIEFEGVYALTVTDDYALKLQEDGSRKK